MDCEKIGKLILSLRKEKGYTQKELAQMMNISDRTISKWERGLGVPDISLLLELSKIFEINIDGILKGELLLNDGKEQSMKNVNCYTCENCGNIVISLNKIDTFCCGRKMKEVLFKKCEDNDMISTQEVDNEWYITSKHNMEKQHYISYVLFVTGNKVEIIKQYPEWDLQVRIPKMEHGKLMWICTNHGGFYRYI